MNKEQVYDEQIAPLMTQIIDICKTHKIALVASFKIPNDDDPDLHCTTTLTTKEYDPSRGQIRAAQSLAGGGVMMLTTRNAEGQITNMTAVAD